MSIQPQTWNGAGTWDLLARPDFPYDVYVHKTITANPIQGSPKAIWREGSGVYNRVGLDNPGIDRFKREVLPRLRPQRMVVSILGDWSHIVSELNASDKIWGIELNLSCPNYELPKQEALAVASVHSQTDKVIIAKLSPLADVKMAQACEDAGADYLCLTNSLDVPEGGLSGPPIQSLSLHRVEQAAKHVSIPIIGMGGISTDADKQRYIDAGASAVGIGSANLGL